MPARPFSPVVCLLLCLAAPVRAFEIAPLPAGAQLTVDGRLDEPAWQSAPLNERFWQFQPEDGRTAPERYRTSVRVLADEQALVFAIRAWHPFGEQVSGSLARRDKVARDQDYVGVHIDPTGHGRSSQFVRINVAGVLADGIYHSEKDEDDFGPDFPVQAAVVRHADGYSVELRWPLSSLRFPYRGTQGWRVMVERSVPGADGMLLVSNPLRKNTISFIAAMDELKGMGPLAAAASRRAYWEVRPELTLRRVHENGKRSDSASLAADINARPRADLVFNATINPDFSQVEIDEPTNAGASRIALSLPEKRAFFLESADVLGMRLPAFYSRTVADPRWGARMTWRGAGADATALSLADRAGGVVMRGSAYATEEHIATHDSRATLLRARRHMPGMVAGAFVSQRDYGRGGVNTVLGADLQANPVLFAGGNTLATVNLMRSTTSAWFDDSGALRRGASRQGSYALGRLHHSSDDWFNVFQLEAVDADFVNDNGFLPQAGIVKGVAEINRRLGASELLGTYETELHLGLFEDRTLHDEGPGVPAGEVTRRWIRPGFWVYGPRQTGLWAELALDRQRARTGGELHRTPGVALGFESAPTPWLIKLAGEMTLGRQLDFELDRVGRGGNVQIEMNMRFALPQGWSLESDHRFNRAWIRHGDRRDFADHAWRWVGTLHASVHSSVRAIVQNSGAARAYGNATPVEPVEKPWSDRARHRSLLYRYIHRHGREFSIGATSDNSRSLPGMEGMSAAHRERITSVTAKFQWES